MLTHEHYAVLRLKNRKWLKTHTLWFAIYYKKKKKKTIQRRHRKKSNLTTSPRRCFRCPCPQISCAEYRMWPEWHVEPFCWNHLSSVSRSSNSCQRAFSWQWYNGYCRFPRNMNRLCRQLKVHIKQWLFRICIGLSSMSFIPNTYDNFIF